jgi:hypothetical protein
VVLAACNLFTGPEAELDAAVRAVDAWVAAHPDAWTLDLSSASPLTRPEWSKPCAANPPSGFVTLRTAASHTEVAFGFRCPLGAAARVEDLTAAFSYAVLDALPHGINSDHWEFEVVTPVSSFEEGVTFSSLPAGRIQVTIETPLYAIYGHSTRRSCEAPADGSSPEGCYLRREHNIPLHLRLSVPFLSSRLE